MKSFKDHMKAKTVAAQEMYAIVQPIKNQIDDALGHSQMKFYDWKDFPADYLSERIIADTSAEAAKAAASKITGNKKPMKNDHGNGTILWHYKIKDSNVMITVRKWKDNSNATMTISWS